tara:strand:+ start:836 stop:1294 length:459 start_codon:yes stop_codon:yes gene_type:complete
MDSIGSYAESLILQDLEGINEGKKSSFGGGGVAAEADMPDISNIDLNASQIREMLTGRNISTEIMPIQEDVQEEYYEEPQAQAEDPISILVEQLSYLVEKAESLVNRLDEMTAVGSCGTNQKFNLMQSEPFTPPPVPKVMKKVKNLRKYRRR